MAVPGTERVTGFLLLWLPTVLGALLILLIGWLLSHFLAQGVLIAGVNAGLPEARLLARGVRWGLWLFTVAMVITILAGGRSSSPGSPAGWCRRAPASAGGRTLRGNLPPPETRAGAAPRDAHTSVSPGSYGPAHHGVRGSSTAWGFPGDRCAHRGGRRRARSAAAYRPGPQRG
jgi:hypothetical protein